MSDNTAPKKQRAPGAGRPAYPADKVTKNISIRLNQAQQNMLKVLGGSTWIRKKLDDELKKVLPSQ
jgi:hypothetical protein